MGKITVNLSDETEKKLCSYISSKYPKQVDSRLSEIVEASVKEFLEKQKDGIGTNQVFY